MATLVETLELKGDVSIVARKAEIEKLFPVKYRHETKYYGKTSVEV